MPGISQFIQSMISHSNDWERRHRDDILAKKKAARDQAAKEAEIAWYEARRNQRSQGGDIAGHKTGKGNNLGEEAAGGTDTTSQYIRISQALTQCIKGSPSRYFLSLYDLFKGSGAMNSEVLASTESSINDLLSSCYRLENEVLQDGVSADYKKVHQLTKRIKCMLDCIVDMQMKVMDPDEDLKKAYEAQQLNFQKQLVQQWMEGTVEIPE
ncbi:hypothetical protein VNI00_016507 [Paramarasmius palmivorus]|uniref:Uncharacterized protein n=1 Tax=Paramarasmius palmivorus TaxID=297713 RepID=A0AAW0BE97_9AGAR